MHTERFHKLAVGTLIILIIIWIFSSRPNENVIMRLILSKIKLYIEGIWFMIFSKDSKGLGPKSNPDPKLIEGKKTFTKRIIFLRHGESDWNDVFNKGFGPSFIFRLISAWFRELKLFHTKDSIFLDSPLNEEGFVQAKELGRFLVEESEKGVPTAEIILGKRETSIVTSSNLRRAISTTTIAMWPRINSTKEKIAILSCLQEISRNVDTKALSENQSIPVLDRIANHIEDGNEFIPEHIFNATENKGNKTTGFNGIKRLKAFNEWAFTREESTIIVGGHSLWFKHFFATFLPFDCDHDAKKKKLVNSGVVSFILHRHQDESSKFGPVSYRIDPASIETVYGGFTSK